MLSCIVGALWLLPGPASAWHRLEPLSERGTDDGQAVAELTLSVASLITWFLLAWLIASVAILMAIRVPGPLGRAARSTSQLVVPGVMRRLLCGALSLSIVGGIAAGTQAGSSAANASAHYAVERSVATDLDWPSAAGPSADRVDNGAAPTPSERAVAVKPGDCLWEIAAKALHTRSERAIAQEWPRWWERNRSVIGDDPNLIHPGQRLYPPHSIGQLPHEEKP